MAYQHTYLHNSINIRSIISIHYFEYMSDFTFPGEQHDFWELVCVDKGEIQAVADNKTVTLKHGSIIFHQPGEFHNVVTNGRISPSLIVIGFDCRSHAMKRFAGQVLTVRDAEASLLSEIIIEARNAFEGRLNNPYQESLSRRSVPRAFGSEQLIKNYLEELLISLYRRCLSAATPLSVPAMPVSRSFPLDSTDPGVNSRKELCSRVECYMEARLDRQLTVTQICRDNLISQSQLSRIFKEFHQCGPIDFFIKLKTEAAKQLIRDNQMNFSQVADRLGYASIHYFSRQFSKQTGMTPTEYAESIRCLAEKNAAGWNFQDS